MDTYRCHVCGFVYDENKGLELENIAPGTKWHELDDDWICPDCGVGKSRFSKN